MLRSKFGLIFGSCAAVAVGVVSGWTALALRAPAVEQPAEAVSRQVPDLRRRLPQRPMKPLLRRRPPLHRRLRPLRRRSQSPANASPPLPAQPASGSIILAVAPSRLPNAQVGSVGASSGSRTPATRASVAPRSSAMPSLSARTPGTAAGSTTPTRTRSTALSSGPSAPTSCASWATWARSSSARHSSGSGPRLTSRGAMLRRLPPPPPLLRATRSRLLRRPQRLSRPSNSRPRARLGARNPSRETRA